MKSLHRGAIYALLSEYKRVIQELITVIQDLQKDEVLYVFDEETEDKDCRTIQGILTHCVRSGEYYSNAIEVHLGGQKHIPQDLWLYDGDNYRDALLVMYIGMVDVFNDQTDDILEEKTEEKKILTRWGQRYDIEQLMEHAIVHVMRHRRQIEGFLRSRKNN